MSSQTKRAASAPRADAPDPRAAARAALAQLTGYGIGPGGWISDSPEGQAEMVFRAVPSRLDGIAKLMIGLTTGSEQERDHALWFLHGALQAEARAMRLAVGAVRDDVNGYIRRPAEPKRRVRA